MRRLLLFLVLPFLISAEPVTPLPTQRADQDNVPLIIQPYYIKDIYRNQIVDSIPFHVTVVTFRNFDNDMWRESKRYAITHTYSRANPKGTRPIFMLGDKQEFEGTYISVFRDKDCLCYLMGSKVIPDDHHPIRKAISIMNTRNVYVVSDNSDIAKYREETLRTSLKDLGVKITVAHVNTASELRAKVVSWNSLPQGLLFINAFDLLADSGKRVRYRYIEQIITDFNNKHLEVGVYRDNHRSALAVGLDPEDIGSIIVSMVRNTQMPIIKVKSSVNVARLGQLNLLHMAAGSFKEALLYEPIDTR